MSKAEVGTKPKRAVKAHWIVLAGGFVQVSLAALLMVLLSITPSGTLEKIEGLSWSNIYWLGGRLLVDIGVYALALIGVLSLVNGLVYMVTTRISLRKTGIEWQTGLIHQHAARMQYRDMESVTLYRSWLGAILGYGTVTTYGKGSGTVKMEYITSPKKLMAHINNKIRASGGEPSSAGDAG